MHDRLAERDMKIHLSDAARDKLAEAGFDPVYGARPLKRAIQNQIENPLAQKILAGDFESGSTIRVDVDGSAELCSDRVVFPNGCVITPDGRTLLVAETFAHRITAFALDAQGRGEAVGELPLVQVGATRNFFVTDIVFSNFGTVATCGRITDTSGPLSGRIIVPSEDTVSISFATGAASPWTTPPSTGWLEGFWSQWE